jgi:hypothetical protein
MMSLSLIAGAYSVFFIIVLIPRYESATLFFKIASVIVLYVSSQTLYKHLTSLNSVIISVDKIELSFLVRKTIVINWDNLTGMEIYKFITHYWKLTYLDKNGEKRIFKTSLAFPGIMDILISIQNHKPDLEMNELLTQVLLYKRSRLA